MQDVELKRTFSKNTMAPGIEIIAVLVLSLSNRLQVLEKKI